MNKGRKFKKNRLFSLRLAKAIKTRGVSYRELAARMDIAVTNLYSYLRGNSEPGAFLLTKLSWTLNVSANYLLGLEDADTKLTKSPEYDLYSQVTNAHGEVVGEAVPYSHKWEKVEAEKLLQEQPALQDWVKAKAKKPPKPA